MSIIFLVGLKFVFKIPPASSVLFPSRNLHITKFDAYPDGLPQQHMVVMKREMVKLNPWSMLVQYTGKDGKDTMTAFKLTSLEFASEEDELYCKTLVYICFGNIFSHKYKSNFSFKEFSIQGTLNGQIHYHRAWSDPRCSTLLIPAGDLLASCFLNIFPFHMTLNNSIRCISGSAPNSLCRRLIFEAWLVFWSDFFAQSFLVDHMLIHFCAASMLC